MCALSLVLPSIIVFGPAFVRCYDSVFSDFTCSRSRNFWILPVDVLGKGPKTSVLGTLKRARRLLQKAKTSASSGLEAPGFNSTKAQGVSPHFASGRATTAASITEGCWGKTSLTLRPGL